MSCFSVFSCLFSVLPSIVTIVSIVAIVTGRAFLVDERKPTLSFRLNYSTPTDEQITKGVDILAEVAKTIYR